MAQLAVRVAPDDAPIVPVTCFPLTITRIGQWRLPLVAFVPADVAAMMAEGIKRLRAPPHLRLVYPQPEQLVLPLRKPRRVSRRAAALVTPLMQLVETVVRRHANAAMPMPNNPALGALCGGRGRNTVWKALNRLVVVGRLLIEVKDGKRRVWVRDAGVATGWGDYHVNPHAPYSVNPKGSVQKRAPSPEDVEEAEDAPAGRSEPQRLVEVESAEACCWPMWAHNEKPTHIYCDAPIPPGLRRRGVSYCATHAPAGSKR